MYGKEFWKRSSISHILEYINSGGELRNESDEKQSAEERHMHYSTTLTHEIYAVRDKIIAFDWSSLCDNDCSKTQKTEEIFYETINIIGKLNDLAFEVGIYTGIKIFDEVKARTGHKAD